MWTAFGLLFGLALPAIAVVGIICFTVRGHHKRELKAATDQRRFEANRETEKLLIMKQIWDEQAELVRLNLPSPNIDAAWTAALRRMKQVDS